MELLEDEPDWVVIGRAPGMRELAFQRAAPWVPGAPESGSRVFADPADHPFCLVFGRPASSDPHWR